MMTKLKQECGYEFTRHIENMFKDVEASRSITSKFKAWNGRKEREVQAAAAPAAAATEGGAATDEASGGSGGGGGGGLKTSRVKLDVSVLTHSHWPKSVATQQAADASVALPPPVQVMADRFMEFYLESHNGRKLAWQCGRGQAEVKVGVCCPFSRLSSLSIDRSIHLSIDLCISYLSIYRSISYLSIYRSIDLTPLPHLTPLISPPISRRASPRARLTSSS